MLGFSVTGENVPASTALVLGYSISTPVWRLGKLCVFGASALTHLRIILAHKLFYRLNFTYREYQTNI